MPEYLTPVIQNIPQEMKDCTQWVVWRAEQQNGASKPTKVPYDPKSKKHAKCNDDDTWASFEDALKAYEKGGFDGIGFQLSSSPFVGIDLDHCRKPRNR